MYTFVQICPKMKWDFPEQVQYRTLTHINIITDISKVQSKGFTDWCWLDGAQGLSDMWSGFDSEHHSET